MYDYITPIVFAFIDGDMYQSFDKLLLFSIIMPRVIKRAVDKKTIGPQNNHSFVSNSRIRHRVYPNPWTAASFWSRRLHHSLSPYSHSLFFRKLHVIGSAVSTQATIELVV